MKRNRMIRTMWLLPAVMLLLAGCSKDNTETGLSGGDPNALKLQVKVGGAAHSSVQTYAATEPGYGMENTINALYVKICSRAAGNPVLEEFEFSGSDLPAFTPGSDGSSTVKLSLMLRGDYSLNKKDILIKVFANYDGRPAAITSEAGFWDGQNALKPVFFSGCQEYTVGDAAAADVKLLRQPAKLRVKLGVSPNAVPSALKIDKSSVEVDVLNMPDRSSECGSMGLPSNETVSYFDRTGGPLRPQYADLRDGSIVDSCYMHETPLGSTKGNPVVRLRMKITDPTIGRTVDREYTYRLRPHGTDDPIVRNTIYTLDVQVVSIDDGPALNLDIQDWDEVEVDVNVPGMDITTDSTKRKVLRGASDPFVALTASWTHNPKIRYAVSMKDKNKGGRFWNLWLHEQFIERNSSDFEIGALIPEYAKGWPIWISIPSDFEGGYLHIRPKDGDTYEPFGLSRYIALEPVTTTPVRVDTEGPANCFIVPPVKGHYSFEAKVMGHGAEGIVDEGKFVDAYGNILTKAGGAALPAVPQSAKLLWQDSQGLVDQVAWNAATQQVEFLTTGKEGNAVIAVYDQAHPYGEAKVLWSWHLWIAEKPQDLQVAASGDDNYTNIPYVAMDRNLGALRADPSDGQELTLGTMYGWGFKNPYPIGYDDASTYTKVLNVRNTQIEMSRNSNQSVDKVQIESILNPLRIPLSTTGGKRTNLFWLWGSPETTDVGGSGTKTIQDPCPAGYKVAPYDFYMIFSGNCASFDEDNNGGWFYYQGKQTGATLWLPYKSRRSDNYGGEYWAANAYPGASYQAGTLPTVTKTSVEMRGSGLNGMRKLRCIRIK